jgi:hypothetical protein
VYGLCASLLELFFGRSVGALARDRLQAHNFTDPEFVAAFMSGAKKEMASDKNVAQKSGEGCGWYGQCSSQ